MLLSAYAFLIYLPLTIIPALLQALNRDRAVDHALSVVTLVLLSLPDFLLATILLLAFVVMIPLLPAISLVDDTSSGWEYFRAMTLPALTLAIVMAVYAVRMLRDNLIEVLDSDYIRMAELKGLSRRRVLLRHALPNALVPTLNVTALNLAYLVGGVVVVEKVFSYPGFGSLLVEFAAIARPAGDRGDGDDRRVRLRRRQPDRRCRGDPPQPATADRLTMSVENQRFRRRQADGPALLPLWRQTPMSFRIGLIILILHLVRGGDRAVLGALRLLADGYWPAAFRHELCASFRRRPARPRHL